jgi:hypothetical protein
VPAARQPSVTASVPRALTLIAGITGAIGSSSAVTDSAKPGARPIPPPSTIRSGSTTVMTAQMVLATRRASSATTACARASPAAAASKTRRADTEPRMPPRRAARTTPDADAAASSVPRFRASCSSAPAPPDSGMKAISPATPWAPRSSWPPRMRPMPIPVPICTKAKFSASRPWPSARSARAAASTSFSMTKEGPNASRSPVRAAGRSHPRRPPVSFMALRRGSYTPGLPITVWVMADLGAPASRPSMSASSTSSATRPRTLVARARNDALVRISPVRSAIAPRTYSCPRSRPSTSPASGRISYSWAVRPGTPVRCPAMRTRPARSTLPRASETVGLDSPETRASSAREHAPRWRMCPRSSCSFSALIKEGRAADRPAAVPSGGGRADAEGGRTCRADAGRSAGAARRASSDRAVTASSLTIVLEIGPPAPEVTDPGAPRLRPRVSSPGALSRADS